MQAGLPGGPGMVRARLPAKPLISVSGREPRAESFEKNHPRVKRGVFNDRAKPMLLALRVQRVI